MFRPSLHGWPFRDTYTCAGPELGLGRIPPAELGLGGGMCWAALDRYLRGAGIHQTEAPEPGDALHAELVARQVAALSGVWSTVETWQTQPDGSWRDRLPIPVPLPGRDLASRTRARWREVRNQLDAGTPVLLTLLLRSDGYRQSRAIRQVLATDWSKLGPRITLSVYDPDCPGDDDIRLSFNTAGPLDARLSGEADLRGFFPVPYDRTPPATIHVEPFDNRSVLGLNRKVRGVPTATAGRGRVDLVARNERGALIHFGRADGNHWEGVNVTAAEDFGAHELHSDPTAFQRAGVLHVFARSYVGDLLHFRQGRTWSVTNRTEQKGAGARFRLAGRPVAIPGPRLEVNVLGRDASGGLVHYFARPLRGWRAEQVPGDPVATDPLAARDGDTLHVIGLAHDGRLLHWMRRETWGVTDTDAGDGPTVRLTGTPAMILRDGRVHVFGREADGRLASLTLGDDGTWQRDRLADGIAGDPAVTTGPAGLHVFAPAATGGVIHAWETRDGWTHEDILETRPTLRTRETGDGDVVCWATDSEIRVFVRRGRVLRALTWTPDADWVVDPLMDRADLPPALIRDARGRPHLVTADAGTAIHVETGAWKEPRGPVALRLSVESASPAPPQEDAVSRPETAEEPTVPEVEDEVMLRSTPDTPETDLPGEPGPAETAPAQPPANLPGLDVPDEPEESQPEETPLAAQVSADLPELGDPEEGDADAEAGAPRPKREFRWETDRAPVSPEEVEPIDLSSLDNWPPVKPSRRSRREHESAGGSEADREVS